MALVVSQHRSSWGLPATARLACIGLVIVSLTSCATKNSGFIGAKDYPQPKLPATAVVQRPAYSVPPATAAEDSIDFVKRPRPLPDFIGRPPDNYDTSKIHSRYSQVMSIGYNSRDEVSLLITPFRKDADDSRLQQVFANLGVTRTATGEAGLQEYTASSFSNINVYSYYNSIMISIGLDEQAKKQKRKKSKKGDPATDHSAEFEFINNMRELLLEN